MKKIALALKAAKLPIFQMFLLVRKEWADVTPLKNGDCRVSFWDDSSFILLKDGSTVFEYVVDHVKYNHLAPLFFRASNAHDAKKQYLSSENSWMKHDDVRVGCLSYQVWRSKMSKQNLEDAIVLARKKLNDARDADMNMSVIKARTQSLEEAKRELKDFFEKNK